MPNVSSDCFNDDSSGEELRRVRERNGLTQQQLADILHVTSRTIRTWEADHVPDHAVERVAKWMSEQAGEVETLGLFSDHALLVEIGRRLKAYTAALSEVEKIGYSFPQSDIVSGAHEPGVFKGRRGSRAPE